MMVRIYANIKPMKYVDVANPYFVDGDTLIAMACIDDDRLPYPIPRAIPAINNIQPLKLNISIAKLMTKR